MIGRKLTPDDLEVQSCVYKLFCGDRYVIVKGKTLAGSIYLIERGYAGFIAGGGRPNTEKDTLNKKWEKVGGSGQNEWDGTNSYYMKLYKFIKENPLLPIRHEVLIESDNAYVLLKTEQMALDAAVRDKKCLNNNLTSYIPIYRAKTKSYGWMNRGSVLAFKKFLKAR